ncbi:MAG: hypothetical protein F6K32_14245 [Desertifilum sp. SIO1I2]|nr:hypothetical protein [Desertifilum sp. SIO1I2]
MRLPWAEWEINGEVEAVAKKFVLANCYDPKIGMRFFEEELYQVPETQNPQGFDENDGFKNL